MRYLINGDLEVEHITSLNSGGNRNTKPAATLVGFPNPQINVATEFTFNFHGRIWPESKALELIELCKNPDNTDIKLIKREEDGAIVEGIGSGVFSVKTWDINLKKPTFLNGELVYNFSLKLTQYADAGDIEDSDVADTGNVFFDLLGATAPKDFSIPSILGTIVTVFSAGIIDGNSETKKILKDIGLPE